MAHEVRFLSLCSAIVSANSSVSAAPVAPGTSETLRRLGTRPRRAFARALLRDTRWDAAEAGWVPILGQPAAFATARELVRIRVRRAAAVAAARCAGAALGGGLAGLLGGAAGGLILMTAPGGVASRCSRAAVGYRVAEVGASGDSFSVTSI
jgi:hypothetical protein